MEGQIRPLSPWYSAWEEQRTRQLLFCIQHGDRFQIPKEDQIGPRIEGGCKELTLVGLEGPRKWHQFHCRSSAGPTNLVCRLWQIFSGNTRDNTPLNLGVNSWRMKMQGRSRSYLIAYSKYAERWVSAWRRERWSWTRPNADELPKHCGKWRLL